MIQEVKAYRTSDGRVLSSESDALHHEIASLVVQGLNQTEEIYISGEHKVLDIANSVVEVLKKNDAKVSALLSRWRSCNPHPAGKATP